MPHRAPRRPRPPLDQARLEELALSYVGRFATTRAKLATYLGRKLRERGWVEDRPPPDIGSLVERHARSGLIDDAAFALAKSQSLSRRGYGKNRVRQQLRGAGVGEEDGVAALEHAANEAIASALRMAERRRFGPYGADSPDPRQRQRQVAAMVRAGHSLGLSLAIVRCPPGAHPGRDELAGNL